MYEKEVWRNDYVVEEKEKEEEEREDTTIVLNDNSNENQSHVDVEEGFERSYIYADR